MLWLMVVCAFAQTEIEPDDALATEHLEQIEQHLDDIDEKVERLDDMQERLDALADRLEAEAGGEPTEAAPDDTGVIVGPVEVESAEAMPAPALAPEVVAAEL